MHLWAKILNDQKRRNFGAWMKDRYPLLFCSWPSHRSSWRGQQWQIEKLARGTKEEGTFLIRHLIAFNSSLIHLCKHERSGSVNRCADVLPFRNCHKCSKTLPGRQFLPDYLCRFLMSVRERKVPVSMVWFKFIFELTSKKDWIAFRHRA